MISFLPSITEVAISEFSIMYEPSPTKTIYFLVRTCHLDAEAPGNLVAHARVAVLHVVVAGQRRTPQFVQLCRQGAGSAHGHIAGAAVAASFRRHG